MLIDSPAAHHHIHSNGPSTNFIKIATHTVNSSQCKPQMHHKQLAQDLSKQQMHLNNHSASSSISSHSSSISPGNSTSSTPSSLLSGSCHFNNARQHENDPDHAPSKSDGAKVNATSGHTFNRITAIKSINTSLNENKNTCLSQSAKVRILSNGSNNPTHLSGANTQVKSLKVRVQNVPGEETQIIKEHAAQQTKPHQTGSIRNLSDANHLAKMGSNVNYTNLQMALKAATAALEKSKIAASSVYSKSSINSQSNANIATQYETNFKRSAPLNILTPSGKNNLSQSQSSIPSLLSASKDLNRTSQSGFSSSTSTNNLNVASTASINSSNEAKPLASNQSLFQPYTKPSKDNAILKSSQPNLTLAKTVSKGKLIIADVAHSLRSILKVENKIGKIGIWQIWSHLE